MKKMKRFKKVMFMSVACAMALSLFAGTQTMSTLSANAAVETGTTSAYDSVLFHGGSQTLVDGNDVEHKVGKAASVKLSDTALILPASVTKIRTPRGNVVAVTNNSFVFNELGFYSLIIGKYEGLRIECVVDGVELSVDSANIPTLVKAGETFNLPDATIVDSRGKVTANNSGYTIAITVIKPDGTTTTGKEVVTTATEGAYFVRYTATQGASVLMKDFTVKTQTNFEDTEKPNLNLVGMPSNANVRTKVTLPTATAKDNYDTNVSIAVSIKDPDGNTAVKEATINKDGYTLSFREETVKFDNNKFVSFYPEKQGSYVITYVATDDNGNTDSRSFKITVKDSKAPVIVVKEENLIPATWGLHTSKANNVEVTTLSIPKGMAYDNEKYTAGETGDFTSVADVQIKAPDGTYIYDQLATTKINLDDCVSAGANGIFILDFNKLTGQNNKGLGIYTIIYTSTDANKTLSTKEYKVDLKDTYSVDKAPTIDAKAFPNALEVGTILKGLSTLNISLSSDSEAASDKVSAKVSGEGTKYYFTPSSGTETEITSDIGANGYMLTQAGTLRVVISASDPLGNKAADVEQSVQVLDFMAGEASGEFAVSGTLHADTSNLEDFNAETASATASTEGLHFFLDDSTIPLASGNFEKAKATFTTGINAGFEAYVMYEKPSESVDANLAVEYVQSDVKFVESIAEGKKTIYILDAYVPTMNGAGNYTLCIRTFEQGFTGKIWSYTVTVNGETSGGGPRAKAVSAERMAATVGESGNAYAAQILSDSTSNFSANGYLLQRTVSGKRFSIMNTYFTPMTANDSYVVTTLGARFDNTTGVFRTKGLDISNNAPVIERPSTGSVSGVTFKISKDYTQYYTAIDARITIPTVTPISANGNVTEFKRWYTTPNGTKTDLKEDAIEFKASTNGVYTITYSAKTKTSTAATFDVKITVGDVVAPKLDVESKPATTMAKGSKFKFSTLTAEDSVTTAAGELKYKRVLLSPDGAEVLSDENNTAGTEEATLSQIGVYTVTYTVTDKAGNPNTIKYSISIPDKVAQGSVTQTVTTVLIVVLCLLVVGLLIYFFVFRKIDLDKKKKKKLGGKKSSNTDAKVESKSEVTSDSAVEPIDVEATEVETPSVESDKKD